MFKKATCLFLSIVFGLALSAHAKTVVWISETNANAGVYYDQGWIDLLKNEGYTVDFRPGEWMTLDAGKLATLKEADLIIASRNSNSGNYATDIAEVTQWNSISTPLILMTVYWCRNNRWMWINNTTITEFDPETMMQVVDSAHPVFEGIKSTNGLIDVIDETVDGGQNSFIITNNVGNGTLIAQRADDKSVWIAEWPAGVEFYAGSGQKAADKRMLFLAGGGGGQTAGSMNLNEDGIKVFLNAVKYMGGSEPRLKAFNPNPADGATITDTWVNLSWNAGESAVSHDVYLGDNLNDVQAAARNSELFRGNQTATFYVAGFPGYAYPNGLVPGTTYYWRIDEVNDADPNSPWKGNVWSFSIPPKTAYNPVPADGAASVALDAKLSWTAGFGSKLHTVYLGDNFDTVNNAAGGLPQAAATYTPAALQAEKVYYWRVDEFDGSATYKGNAWAFTTLGAAGSPLPANGATGVQMTAKLSWTPATNATSHDVYFGTDKNAVRNATSASPEYKGSKAKGSETYDAGKLAWHTAYYWRVDAVYSTGTVKGLVWSFTTADFITVDDFESYNDIDPPDPASHRIFDAWVDGYASPTTNGALVGNDLPPYAEQKIVHSGAQSMPYSYNNANKTSEATMTLVYPRDWTEEGVEQLSLWFRGSRANAAERMYVVLNGNAVVYHDDSAAAQKTGWTEWVIALQAFQGVTLTNVNTITIGFGTKGSPAAGGSGKMYFDDIRLYRPRTP